MLKHEKPDQQTIKDIQQTQLTVARSMLLRRALPPWTPEIDMT